MSGAAAAALRRSGSNSLSALLRADDDDPPPRGLPGAAAAADDGLAATKRRGGGGGRTRGRRRALLRLPLGGAGGCRVCDCDEAEPAPPRRRAMVDGEDEAVQEEGEERLPTALQCFSWKKCPAVALAITRRGRALAAEDAAAAADFVAEEPSATTLSALPDDLLEMVLSRLPLSSLLAARCACRRWRDLTVAPQLLRRSSCACAARAARSS